MTQQGLDYREIVLKLYLLDLIVFYHSLYQSIEVLFPLAMGFGSENSTPSRVFLAREQEKYIHTQYLRKSFLISLAMHFGLSINNQAIADLQVPGHTIDWIGEIEVKLRQIDVLHFEQVKQFLA